MSDNNTHPRDTFTSPTNLLLAAILIAISISGPSMTSTEMELMDQTRLLKRQNELLTELIKSERDTPEVEASLETRMKDDLLRPFVKQYNLENANPSWTEADIRKSRALAQFQLELQHVAAEHGPMQKFELGDKSISAKFEDGTPFQRTVDELNAAWYLNASRAVIGASLIMAHDIIKQPASLVLPEEQLN